ncbi:MAG: TauD/TfdA family dioxygenase [Pseudomonadota bacterium]
MNRAVNNAPSLTPVTGPGVWRRDGLSEADWRFSFDAASRRELRDVASILATNPLDVRLLNGNDYPLDATRAFAKTVTDALTLGSGLCLLSGLPIDDVDDDIATKLYWLVSQMLARPVAQSFDGRVLYDVRDTGQRIGTRTRGDLTRQELSWHTDYGFNYPPPIIGLLALRTGKAGGVSRVASLLQAHNQLLSTRPDLLARLYQPFHWNRQGEHPEGAPVTHFYPIYERADGEVRARFIKWLLYRGYELVGEPFDALGQEALEALFDTLSEPANHLTFELERGQIQFMNNFRLVHCRSEYDDYDDPALKRHLVRIFLRNEGRASYMG